MDTIQLAHAFFDAIERADHDALRRFISDDTQLWHNYDQVEMPFTQVLPGLMALAATLQDFKYAHRRYLSVSNGVVAQHSLTGILPNGEALDVPAMVRLHVADGHVTRFEEYLDSSATKPLVAALFKPDPK